MRSPSGVVDWLCAKCRGENIVGPLTIMGQKSGACGDCLEWWPWKQRVTLGHYPKRPAKPPCQSPTERASIPS